MDRTIRKYVLHLSKILLGLFLVFNLQAKADCTNLPAFDFTSGRKISTNYINQLADINGVERVHILKAWAIEGIDELEKTILFCNMPDDLKQDIKLIREKLENVKFEVMSDLACFQRTRIDASAWTTFYSDTIYFCNVYFYSKDPRSQFTTLIHELFHTIGLDHGPNHANRIQILTLLLARVDNWRDFVRFSSTSMGYPNEHLIMCFTNSKCRKKFNSKEHSSQSNTEWLKILDY